MNTVLTPKFNDTVAAAIAANTDIKLDQIIVLDNSDKYAPQGIKPSLSEHEDYSLSQVFHSMANINSMALQSDDLCAGTNGPSFRDTLFGVIAQIAPLVQGRPLRYVELGPEPYKSSAIIAQLLAAGVRVVQYVGIDINPESQVTMRKAIAPLVGEENFSYIVADFYQCSFDDIPKPSTGDAGDLVTLVTNLGFQEGNDLPSRIGPMLRQLTRRGDLLLAEMQVSGEVDERIIRGFYDHPEMRRLSGQVGRQYDPECSLAPTDEDPTEYLFRLVPVQTDVGLAQVAATIISVNVEGNKKYVLTNSCIKYTPEQFKLARELAGTFVVRADLRTGDKSVVIHIAERI